MRKTRKLSPLLYYGLSILLLLSAGCTGSPVSEEESGLPDRVTAVATIFPLADIVCNIGGEHVEVTVLLRPGESPHTFEPTVEQARAAAGADLLFYIGGGLDDWALGPAGKEGLAAVKVTDHLAGHILDYDPVDPEEVHRHSPGTAAGHSGGEAPETEAAGDGRHSHCHGPLDPHVWTDPLLVRDLIAPLVAQKLAGAAPQHEQRFNENLTAFQEELQELHDEISAMVKGFSRTRFISYHSAWSYFAHRYGLVEAATVARFPGKEPSAKWLAGLIRLAGEHQIDVIFAEPQLSGKAASVIAAEIGGRVLILDPLGGEGVPGRDSYVNLMRYNARIFKEALE